MSDEELIRKFYYGSYQISKYDNFLMNVAVVVFCFHSDSKGYLACPLYDERKNEDNQICSFYIQNQSADLTDEEFACFWSHVQNVHPDTYLDILKLCRSKIPNISKNNQVSCCLLLKTSTEHSVEETNKNIFFFDE